MLSGYAHTIRLLLILPLAALAGGCDWVLSTQPQSQEAAKAEKSSEPPAVTQTAELIAATRADGLSGVATILNADALLQLHADLSAARISADFSTATAARYKATNSLSRQIIETAERQAGIDTTQRKLLESRLKQTWGEAAPFLDEARRQTLIAGLSAGSDAMVRMDFPAMMDGAPRDVKIAALSGGKETPVKTLWAAPSGNLSMPGVSYFGLIDAGPGMRPGDRARVIAVSPNAKSGVIVPSAAVVLFQGQSWCYVATDTDKETGAGKFERRAITLDHPVEDGYLVTAGLTAGQRVVVRGASMLLSREAGPGDDDDDDGDDAGHDDPKPKPAVSASPVAPPQSNGPQATVANKRGAPAAAAADKD